MINMAIFITSVIGVVTLVAGIIFALWPAQYARDDTDPPEDRSGMALYTDAKTGCQYLGSSRGGITLRLDRDGKHICENSK